MCEAIPDQIRTPEPVPDQVRAACAWVAARAGFVEIDRRTLEEYVPGLLAAVDEDTAGPPPPARDVPLAEDERERQAGLVICLDAVNFGSGWWPTIRRRAGRSGYSTIAAALTDHFRALPWSARELTELSAQAVAYVLDQEPDHPLMGLYADALRDVGGRILADHRGRFTNLLDAAQGSAVVLVDLLSRWRAFADVSVYEGRDVPFFKRAQIAAADISRARVAELAGVERLTAFADNLVPHVLRVDGVLRLAPALRAQIDAGELLIHDSPAEVELRACTVHAVELMARALGGHLCPAQIDEILWNRGRGSCYKALERPRCRTQAY